MTKYLPKPDFIPEELRQMPRWGLWRKAERQGGGLGKVPVSPQTGRFIGWQSANELTTFEDAMGKVAKHDADGLNFLLLKDEPYTIIDIDNIYEAKIEPESIGELMASLGSCYAEYSVSGNGIHIVVKGNLPTSGKRRHKAYEMYDDKRFMVFTGQAIFNEKIAELHDAQKGLDNFYQRLFQNDVKDSKAVVRPTLGLDENKLLQLAMRDAKFVQLHQGDNSGYDGDASRADFAYCIKLRYWFQANSETMKRIALTSGRVRPKWEQHPTYLDNTIKNALKAAEAQAMYNPNRSMRR